MEPIQSCSAGGLVHEISDHCFKLSNLQPRLSFSRRCTFILCIFCGSEGWDGKREDHSTPEVRPCICTEGHYSVWLDPGTVLSGRCPLWAPETLWPGPKAVLQLPGPQHAAQVSYAGRSKLIDATGLARGSRWITTVSVVGYSQ